MLAISRVSVACALSLALSACTSFRGAPTTPSVAHDSATSIANEHVEEILEEYSSYTTDEQRLAARNELVTARMFLIDDEYHQYEKSILSEVRGTGFATSLLALFLTSASTVVGGNQAKTILSGGATAILGGKEVFDREILLDQATRAIQTQMQSSRKVIEARILTKLDTPYAKWGFWTALKDVEEYRQAGTLAGALKAATETAAVGTVEGQKRIDDYVTAAFDTSASAEILRAYLSPPPANPPTLSNIEIAERQRRSALVTTQLNSIGITNIPAVAFVETGSEDSKAKLIQLLLEKEVDSGGKSDLAAALSKFLNK